MENKSSAFKNQSMLRDERLSEVESVLKKFNTKYLDSCGAPIGHIYSVLVEEAKIEEPDLQGFIDEINEGLTSVGDGFARIKSPLDRFYSRYYSHLSSYLEKRVKNGELTEESGNKIFKEALGGHLYYGIPFR